MHPGEAQDAISMGDRLVVSPAVGVEVTYPGVPSAPVRLDDQTVLGEEHVDASRLMGPPRKRSLAHDLPGYREACKHGVEQCLQLALGRHPAIGATLVEQRSHAWESRPAA